MAETDVYLKYTPLENLGSDNKEYLLASIVLSRPKQANSFNSEVIALVTKLIKQVKDNDKVRVLVLQGEGRHFCSGAELEWMRASEKLSYGENIQDAEKMREMFEEIDQLVIPTVAVTKGIVYGGAVGLVACCDICISSIRAQFYFSETKIGLIPAVILPYLCRKIALGHLRRYILGPRHFNVAEAFAMGFVQAHCEESDLEALLHEEVEMLLTASPEAQSGYKILERKLREINFQQTSHTTESIALIRCSKMAQEGLDSVQSKEPPPWLCKLDSDEQILV